MVYVVVFVLIVADCLTRKPTVRQRRPYIAAKFRVHLFWVGGGAVRGEARYNLKLPLGC